MAKPVKRKVSGGGRVTPKGGPARPVPQPSGRYTPPIPKAQKISPTWVPALMFTLLALGTVVILLNYVSALPTWGFLPDDTSNMWLLVGLGLILIGIVVATQWH